MMNRQIRWNYKAQTLTVIPERHGQREHSAFSVNFAYSAATGCMSL